MSQTANKKVNGSCYHDDDYKEEESMLNPRDLNKVRDINGDKNWFCINDKLDILHESEWYRGSIRDIDGYSIYVCFVAQNGDICKWIRNCNEIFKYICQCNKECINKQHLIAGYGSQTNYSYDKQIILCNIDNINFNNILNNILFKYMYYNIRDATNSTEQFNDDFNLIQCNLMECESIIDLLHQYQEFNENVLISFNKSSKIQKNMITNTMTLGHYINYLKGSNQAKFKYAIKKQHEYIKNIDNTINENEKQINDLIKQQNELKLKKNTIIDKIKEIKCYKNNNNENIQKLIKKQKECIENVNKSTNILNKYLEENKINLNKLHNKKLKQFEKEYKKWNKQEIISWILMIDNHRFSSCHKYAKFRKMLNKSAINGASLNDLKCETFLKYVGLGIESRTALINNIDRVTMQHNNNNNNHDITNNNDDDDDDTKTEIC